jgi:hypothetical protein
MRSMLRILLAALLLFPPAAVAVDVSGDQWGIWTRVNSPYNVVGEIRVPPESALVIEPGVVVNFQGHYKFIVDSLATLYAVGTVMDSIYFTTEDTATGWNGVRFMGADRKSRIMYSRLEFGRVTGTWPDVNGAAILCYYCSPKIKNNTIIHNTARRGGGICCYTSSPKISNNTITGNSALWGGGICCLERSSPTISNNTITANVAREAGGGIYCRSDCNPIINSNTLSGNLAEEGGGVYCMHSGPTIINSILWGDAARNGPEIYVESGNPAVTYCDVQRGWPGEGNLNVHPLFRESQAGDFHLMASYCGDPYNSPCIDAGHPDSLDAVLDCFHGLGTDRSDIGSYGGNNSGWPTDVEDSEGGLFAPREFLLHQNYPNPFNATTTIRYQLPVNALVKLEVYNLLGQKVATLVSGKERAAYRSVIWEASEVSSGIYFYRLTAGDFTDTRRMMLVK